MKKLWADFKKFITRGNVVDMAVGVAVASAFTAIVTAFTKGFISPILALITPNASLETMKWVIREAVPATDTVPGVAAVEILWGAFVQKIIDFLIIALVLFLVMRIASAVMAHSKKLRENMINALSHDDEEAALAAQKAEEEAKIAAEAAAALEAEEKAKEAKKLAEEEERKRREIELLSEIRDLLKNKE